METTIVSHSAVSIDTNRLYDKYEEFLRELKANFTERASKGVALFKTDASHLFELFLSELPEEARQHYNCNACRKFINSYGGLVEIMGDGLLRPIIWEFKPPEFFRYAVHEMWRTVGESRIRGVFVSSERILGNPVTGEWHHMSVVLPSGKIVKSRLKTSNQIMAEKRENFKILLNSINEFSVDIAKQAVNLLKSESLFRSRKILGVAEWFLALHKSITRNPKRKRNLLWLAVATAPTGFCHIRSSVIGTLLDDIKSGYSFNRTKQRFNDKMNPLQYQRPQVLPTQGNIERAEEVISRLGIATSLERRYAELSEIQTIWKPGVTRNTEYQDGVFGHLRAKGKHPLVNNMKTPTITMTWRKFLETVLPDALEIEYFVKSSYDDFTGLVTAEHKDAPPIIQWDSEEHRNPVSWYIYNGGSPAAKWELELGYCRVTGICYQPSMWNGGYEHQGKSVIFILDGARDTNNQSVCLFPEILKSELREIRSTIESYSESKRLGGYDKASACGIRFQGGPVSFSVRVTTDTGVSTYKLDRWD